MALRSGECDQSSSIESIPHVYFLYGQHISGREGKTGDDGRAEGYCIKQSDARTLKGERKEHRDMLKVQRRVGTKCSRSSRGGLSGTLKDRATDMNAARPR